MIDFSLVKMDDSHVTGEPQHYSKLDGLTTVGQQHNNYVLTTEN